MICISFSVDSVNYLILMHDFHNTVPFDYENINCDRNLSS